MIGFYDIEPEYVRWLREIDPQVPVIEYGKNNKFLCGAVIEMDGIRFYAPVSSNKKILRTNFPIFDEAAEPRRILSTIRFSFMIPAKDEVLTKKDFARISLKDSAYASLLKKEWEYCRNHEAEVLAKAKQVYLIGCNPKHVLNYTCCNFELLQRRYEDYGKEGK